MTKTIYTLISYVPGEDGWHDRCGDYHRGKDSELKIQYFQDVESAGEAMGQSRFEEEDTEFTILINGINEDNYEDFLSKEEGEDLYYTSDKIRDISYEKYEQLKKVKAQKEAEAKLKKEQEEALKKQKEKEHIEQAERAQLAQLQAKYGKTI